MNTQIRRVDLAEAVDLEKVVTDLCDNMAFGGYRLVSTFVYANQLVLIFQK